jgi:hypothetical protein
MGRARRDERPLEIVANFGGWTKVTWRGGKGGTVVAYVRFRVDEQLLMRVCELRITEQWVHLHRELPLGRIENAVNANADLRSELHQHIDDDPGPDLALAFAMKAAVKRGMRYRLERPTSRRLGAEFFSHVARAYTDAVAFGLNPRKTLAADSDTPADTVARWIRETRRRGLLPPASPGRVST